MSIDKITLDKGASTDQPTWLYYFKIIDEELYTISPDHVYRNDLTQEVDIDNALIKLNTETFKIPREAT